MILLDLVSPIIKIKPILFDAIEMVPLEFCASNLIAELKYEHIIYHFLPIYQLTISVSRQSFSSGQPNA